MSGLQIITPRLRIRNMKIEDLRDFHIYRSNPEVTRYQGFDVMDIDQCRDFIARQMDKSFGQPGEWVQYSIEHPGTGLIVGDCAIKLDAHDPRIAEIGMTISHLEQQKGYATEAMHGILKFLFEDNSIHRVVETVDAENVASIKLLQRTGFRQEGHFIENIFFKGAWGSEYQFAMLRREWESMKTV